MDGRHQQGAGAPARAGGEARAVIPLVLAVLLALWPGSVLAAEIVLPQNRQAFYSDEPIEIAVAGLPKNARAALTLTPDRPTLTPLALTVTGDGSTVTVVVPPASLAPAAYAVSVDGTAGPSLTVVRGVPRSSFLVSQTIERQRLPASGANFILSMAFGFGLLDRDGTPSLDLRRRSLGMNHIENAVKMDLPSLIYMYWTGHVLHKPWGEEKSWVDPAMTESMRLLSFHVAQRLRRYQRNILSVGTIDEPGLAWGRTPAGRMVSGFPVWSERTWYAERGWTLTDDPASRPDDDWMTYVRIRAAILAEQTRRARGDLRTVWPGVVFSTDLYAAQALMDGTDPLNQRVNDVAASHVFADWGYGKLGLIGAVYLEKAHDPTAKIAHAMNGQLFGVPVPQPATRHAFHLMMNALLASGVKSNWWLNVGTMTDADLQAVNEPAQRFGPLFLNMTPDQHDVAVLWSFTELAMRLKDVSAKEAALQEGALEKSAYNVGGNYREEVLAIFQALNRAGHPAHVLHEALLPEGALKHYRTLVVVGQTVEPPAAVRSAIEQFVARGGTVIVDRATTVRLPGAIVTGAHITDVGYRWTTRWRQGRAGFATERDASYVETNHYMDDPARLAAPSIKSSLRATRARPAIETDSVFLGAERHHGGDGELIMVLNGYEALPEIPASQRYAVYNHAPYRASFRLAGVDRTRTVYRIEGLDWQTVTRVENPGAIQTASFAPGEMKLYLVAPRPPRRIDLSAKIAGGTLTLAAALKGLRMPWPLRLTVTDPTGAAVVTVYRATNARGEYRESLPLGLNAPAGSYTVRITSPVGNLSAEATARYRPVAVKARPLAGDARVFDAEAIKAFLGARPSVTIAIGSESMAAAAQELAAKLAQSGIAAQVTSEDNVWRKARYPRVWDPYVHLHRKAAADTPREAMRVVREMALETAADGGLVARLPDGKDVGESWRQEPGTLATVTGHGFIDYVAQPEQLYEPGCKLYVDDARRVHVVNGTLQRVASTEEIRAAWSRPWKRLDTYHGGGNLVPQLPEAYVAEPHLILLGDSRSSTLIRALQASEILPQSVDARYPGPGKALVMFAWSPFAVERNAIVVGATDAAGLQAGVRALLGLLPH